MKKNLLFAFIGILISSHGLFAAEDSTLMVGCSTVNAASAFSIRFFGNADDQRTEKVEFAQPNGTVYLTWNAPINGLARNGFIKISQTEWLGPDSRLISTIISEYHPEIPVGTPFSAKFYQWVEQIGKPNMQLANVDLSCTGY